MKKKACSFWRMSFIGTLVVATTMAMTLPTQGWAMLAPSETMANDASDAGALRAADMQTIQKALESKIVRQRLAELKLTPEQIDARLGKLSDAQVHQMASQIRTVNPGGDGGGILITVLVIAVLVAIFFYVFKRV